MPDPGSATPTPTWFDYAMLAAALVILGVAIARGWLGPRFTQTRMVGVLRPSSPWSRWLAVTGLLVLAFIMVNAVAAMAFASGAQPPLPLDTQAIIAAVTFIVLVPAALILPRQILHDGLEPSESSTLRIDPGYLLHGAALLTLVYPVVHAVSIACVLLYTRIAGHPPPDIAHQGLDLMIANRANPSAWALAACALLAAPVFEEIVFRGLLQTGLVKATASPRAGIVIASALFAGAHAGTVAPFALPVLFVFGLCLGLVYERTGRLGVAVGLHMAFNILQFSLALTFAGAGASV